MEIELSEDEIRLEQQLREKLTQAMSAETLLNKLVVLGYDKEKVTEELRGVVIGTNILQRTQACEVIIRNGRCEDFDELRCAASENTYFLLNDTGQRSWKLHYKQFRRGDFKEINILRFPGLVDSLENLSIPVFFLYKYDGSYKQDAKHATTVQIIQHHHHIIRYAFALWLLVEIKQITDFTVDSEFVLGVLGEYLRNNVFNKELFKKLRYSFGLNNPNYRQLLHTVRDSCLERKKFVLSEFRKEALGLFLPDTTEFFEQLTNDADYATALWICDLIGRPLKIDSKRLESLLLNDELDEKWKRTLLLDCPQLFNQVRGQTFGGNKYKLLAIVMKYKRANMHLARLLFNDIRLPTEVAEIWRAAPSGATLRYLLSEKYHGSMDQLLDHFSFQRITEEGARTKLVAVLLANFLPEQGAALARWADKNFVGDIRRKSTYANAFMCLYAVVSDDAESDSLKSFRSIFNDESCVPDGNWIRAIVFYKRHADANDPVFLFLKHNRKSTHVIQRMLDDFLLECCKNANVPEYMRDYVIALTKVGADVNFKAGHANTTRPSIAHLLRDNTSHLIDHPTPLKRLINLMIRIIANNCRKGIKTYWKEDLQLIWDLFLLLVDKYHAHVCIKSGEGELPYLIAAECLTEGMKIIMLNDLFRRGLTDPGLSSFEPLNQARKWRDNLMAAKDAATLEQLAENVPRIKDIVYSRGLVCSEGMENVFFYALANGNLPLAKWLVIHAEYFTVEATGSRGIPALIFAVLEDQPKMVNWLLNCLVQDGKIIEEIKWQGKTALEHAEEFPKCKEELDGTSSSKNALN